MSIPLLVIALLLLVANGFFVGAEVAITASAGRPAELGRAAKSGSRAARLAQASVQELSFMLTGAQLGITMASLALGFVAEPAIADLLEAIVTNHIAIDETLLHATSGVIALLIVVLFHMVIGEMAPKNIAIADPVRTLLWVSIPFRFYANAMRGLLWSLNTIANVVIRGFGIRPRDDLTHAYTREHIGSMLSELRRLGAISDSQQQLANRALRFTTRSVEDVMVPKSAIHSVSTHMTAREIERTAVRTGYSRFPVQGDKPDVIVGFIHVKDLLALEIQAMDLPLPRSLVRTLHVAPETALVGELLLAMRRVRAHMALVIDEHGSPAGIVTLEDLVEELVGEIRDEHDVSAEDIHQVDQNRFAISGHLRLEELERITDCPVPEGDYTTVSGFVMHRLGAVPVVGGSIKHGEWMLRVRRMNGPRIENIDVLHSTSIENTSEKPR
jgi:CBS domain containing-hemolysin-like protein